MQNRKLFKVLVSHFFAEVKSLLLGLCRLTSLTEVFSYNAQINAAFF